MSYGVYVYRSAVIQLVLCLFPLVTSVIQVSVAMVISIALGWLSYNFVEKHFLR